MSGISYLTEEGLKKLKDELDRMVNVERPNISKQIAEARDKGDLSENAEYDAAKEAQGLLEMKISKLQETIRNARIIDPSQINTNAVQILNKVKLRNVKTNQEMEYTIVSESEADLKAMKGLPLIILRPSTVYGPGDVSGIAPRVICAAVYKHLKEKMKFMWSGDLRLSTVHVRDVAAAMWHCAVNVPVGALYNLADKNDTDQAKINKILEAIFGISTGFYGSLISNAARIDFKGFVEEANDKHLKPWSEMCQAAGIDSTPLTPYLDPELLYNNSFSVDGSAIEATGFKYQYPNVSEPLVREMMQYYVEQKLFPVEK